MFVKKYQYGQLLSVLEWFATNIYQQISLINVSLISAYVHNKFIIEL